MLSVTTVELKHALRKLAADHSLQIASTGHCGFSPNSPAAVEDAVPSVVLAACAGVVGVVVAFI